MKGTQVPDSQLGRKLSIKHTSFIKAIKKETKKDLAILLLVIYLKKPKTLNQKDIYMYMSTAALLTIAKTGKQLKCPLIDEQISGAHIHWNDSAIKKNKILPSATTWMDLEGIMMCQISQTEKDKCHLNSFICGI